MMTTKTIADRLPAPIRRLARFEISLALVCLLVPLFLVAFNSWQVADSISAYWNIVPVVFYYGLTAAAILFMVRGARRENSWYAFVLGLALSGVILFNLEYWQPWHNIFAAIFFAGGVAAILKYSDGPQADRLKKPLIGLVILGALAWQLGWITTFWVEWAAMIAMAGHFIAHAIEDIRQEQLPESEQFRYKAL